MTSIDKKASDPDSYNRNNYIAVHGEKRKSLLVTSLGDPSVYARTHLKDTALSM